MKNVADLSSAQAERKAIADYLNTDQAADYTGLSRSWLAKSRVLGGGGPRYAKIGRRVVYRRADLDEYIEERLRRTTSESVFMSPAPRGFFIGKEGRR